MTGGVERPPAYLGVQALRGLAAAMVVVYHATQFWAQHVGDGKRPGPWTNGAAGVDIFFVISGFVMAVSTIGREHKVHPARSFLERRLVRLVPLYWLVTLVVLAKLWFVQSHMQFANSDERLATPWQYVVSSLLFFPYKNSGGVVQPVLFVGWSLSFEMFFYLLFAAALALRTGVVRMLAPIMLVLVVVGFFHTDQWPTAVAFLTKPYLLEFLAGLLLGDAMRKGFRMPVGLAGGVGVVAAVVLLCVPMNANPVLGFVLWAVPACLMVQAVVVTERVTGGWWPRWMLLLGDASYSLYLTHPLVFSVVVKLLGRMHVLTQGVVRRTDELVAVGVALVVSLIAAGLVYGLVERPLTRWLRRNVLGERRAVVE